MQKALSTALHTVVLLANKLISQQGREAGVHHHEFPWYYHISSSARWNEECILCWTTKNQHITPDTLFWKISTRVMSMKHYRGNNAWPCIHARWLWAAMETVLSPVMEPTQQCSEGFDYSYSSKTSMGSTYQTLNLLITRVTFSLGTEVYYRQSIIRRTVRHEYLPIGSNSFPNV